MTTTTTDIRNVPPVGRDEAMALADAEYARFLELLRSLDDADWATPTVCDGWDVRAVALHVLGAAEGCASMREMAHQMRHGGKLAKERGYDHFVHGVNEVQIAERAELAPPQVVERFARVAPRAVRGRRRLPRPARRIPVGFPEPLGKRSLAYLYDLVYTRDVWMHRVDIARAVGREPRLTAEHDGRLMADMVVDWATTHGHAFHLELTGPAGGVFEQGTGGESTTLDAVDWIWTVSGRAAGTGLLSKELPL